MKTYTCAEIFFTLQGEGYRTGQPSVFVRFSGCNLRCGDKEDEATKDTTDFLCDTEFASGKKYTKEELLDAVKEAIGKDMHPYGLSVGTYWVVWTGGEPSLQLDQELVDYFKKEGLRQAIETNGTKELPKDLDWICVAPKSAEHTIVVKIANEVKYVRNVGQQIPKPSCKASYYYISPAWGPDGVDRKTLQWCVDLVKHTQGWSLSLQSHKLLQIR